MSRAVVLAAAALFASLSILRATAVPPAVNDAAITGDAYPATLSEFRFFADAAATRPAENVVPYQLNAPLFSDYAEKRRFVYVPAGQTIEIGDEGRLLFPVGAAIIKTFGYGEGADFTALETRVLLHRASGWVALPYVWNADHSDAELKRAGTRIPVTVPRPDGARVDISYRVPNQNQCKGCHNRDGAIMPIGPKLRNLDDGARLSDWQARGWLPADLPAHDVLPDPFDAAQPLPARARAYLDINCAHCHDPKGPASNSGLFLGWQSSDRVALGIGKRPVAAGRGSGGREFAIDPGHAEASIMAYRMASTDPGVAMPELGRAMVHDEGVTLIRQWIDAMDTKD